MRQYSEFQRKVSYSENTISVGAQQFSFTSENSLDNLKWKGIDVVVGCLKI
jgi:glyceraldehyde-3-phosphate dehydrogenase/erythrose-4-phosphate dehydrogenase